MKNNNLKNNFKPFFNFRFSKLQETIEDKCIDLVQEYGDQIIEIILKEEFDPEQICAILTLCNVSATSTWGEFCSLCCFVDTVI